MKPSCLNPCGVPSFLHSHCPAILAVVAAMTFAGSVHASRTFGFPEENPLISFEVPEDWKVKWKNDSLFVVSPDGGDVIVEVMAMDAASDESEEALKEAKSTVEDFKNLDLEVSDPAQANGLVLSMVGGSGEDSEGPALINMAVIKHPEVNRHILFSLIAAKENASKYGSDCGAMFNSLRVVSSENSAPADASASSKTFTYPDAEKPDFSIDFPADWEMKETDEGVYVESPDQLVAMNVIMVDKADVEDAEEVLKKKVGERFKEILWNGGKDPEVNKDEALGLTATFQNAQASDGEGTEAYSVNLVSYVRKSGDKALILLCQNPMRAIDKHAASMDAVLKSIKVR